jgi:hypothetical protein
MSRKVNLGNYESEDIFVSLACDVEDSTTIAATLAKVEALLDEQVKTRLAKRSK